MKDVFNEFKIFLVSGDPSAYKIGILMLTKSIKWKNISLEDLMEINVFLSQYGRVHYRHSSERDRLMAKIHKHLKKYNSELVWQTYKVVNNRWLLDENR